MANIYIKIHNWQADSKSIIFSAASDETRSKNPDDYGLISIQPFQVISNLNSIETFLKYIARIAKNHCDAQVKNENQADNLEMVGQLQALEGRTFTFDINDVVNDSFQTIDRVQEV